MKPQATILAVDDTTESLALLRDVLTAAGHQVRLADSGELALAAVAAAPPDLILLDVVMPGLDGLEVCRRLKASEETRGIPIILLSAHAGVQEWVQGIQLGAVDHVGKPFQTEELLMRVDTHLALSRAREATAEASALRRLNEQMATEIIRRQQAEADLRQSLADAKRVRQALLSTLEDRLGAEAALREADANLQALLNATTQTIFMMDLEGKVLTLNEITARRLGRTPEQMLGTCIFDHLPPAIVEARRTRLAQVIASGEPVSFEDERSGQILDQMLVPIRDAAGQVVRVAVFAVDITERKRAEDEARLRNEELIRFNEAMVGRELRMIELKAEVDALCQRLQEPPRYGPSPETESALRSESKGTPKTAT